MSDSRTAEPRAPLSDEVSTTTRVLLVDDHAIVAEAIRRMLSTEDDLEYHYCADPARAIAEAVEFQPTEILRDLEIELEKKNTELQRLSSLDGLTGIANRRRFDEYLEQEWLRAARSNKVLSLILTDIDHFKTSNDNYGHQGGDEVQ